MQVVKETDLSQIVKVILGYLQVSPQHLLSMPQNSISQPSMRIALRTLPAMIALLFLLSCSKNDHEPGPSECLFLSKTRIEGSPNPSLSTKVTSSTQIALNDKKQLLGATNSHIRESTESGVTGQRTTESTEFTLTYDPDGFLTRMIKRKVYLFEGSNKSHFLFENYKFKNFRREDVETSDYKYKSGHIASSTMYGLSTFVGDNQTLPVVEANESKVYQYDSNGKPISALTTASYGSASTTFKNGVIASVVQKNLNGVVTSETKYNEMGLPASISNSQSVYEMSYDAKGNLTSVQATTNGQKAYISELFYDDHKNPENDIPKTFKGIPEFIRTVQLTDGINNTTGDKATLFPSNQVFETKTTYQYNSAGLPESSVHTSVGGSANGQSKTTFNYKCL
jgi:YD repeat-containing protein